MGIRKLVLIRMMTTKISMMKMMVMMINPQLMMLVAVLVMRVYTSFLIRCILETSIPIDHLYCTLLTPRSSSSQSCAPPLLSSYPSNPACELIINNRAFKPLLQVIQNLPTSSSPSLSSPSPSCREFIITNVPIV